MKKLLFAIVAYLAIACNSGNEEKDSIDLARDVNESLDSGESQMPDTLAADHIFLAETYSTTRMQKQLGEHAAANARSSAVKQYGRLMAIEHAKADSAITIIGRYKAIAIPNVPGDKHQSHINDLTKKTGEEFDKDYMKLMVKQHENDIKKFEEAAEDAKDADIRKFAAKALPTLKRHLDAAKKIEKQL